MTQGFIARAHERLLSIRGEEALLRGVSAGKIHLEHNVELSAGDPARSDDNHVVRVTVASILPAYEPRVGDRLEHPDGTFLLDRRVRDSKYLQRFIAVKA